ncbi:type IV toxin-antitoxin system AbiEi family antitoxin domain-containing protein [Nocardioides sp. HDW12B]|uniref:type IV toxin-antitoxin system AbiEi family antitoxin domain-containing protein n=1 Tax=Nocardioides sp. HDW12B TaxID=2714939 RepID=UPI00140E6692|nr:type IV toxin-antitoxin system AbiEi family antitoxin domain-containing protein [Nocardioides sp. HDW12B]QIK68068.1 type IV toxin-antitoxin system AbiEi family antitoxin domain-containing protein [Nocardioides sp. HDW12B]
MDRRLLPVLEGQDGVVARRQALAVGLTAENVERLLRRNELAAIHPGVYVDHTGTPSWDQRAWAAVLWGWPAVLSHSSALAVVEGPGSPHRSGVIEIAVVKDRRLLDRPGVVVRRSAHVAARTQVGAPPRIRYDEAVLDVVARLDRVDDVVAEVSRVVQGRCTSPDRLLSTVRSRRRVRHRDLLVDVLGDLAAGATSALERRYLCDVERPHGLPQAIRQLRHRTRDGVVYRDVLYLLAGRLLVLELDGRGFHQSARQRDRDLERDLLARIEHGAETARLGWGQCAGRPCRTAGMVGVLLRRMGWTGRVHGCRPGCEAPLWFDQNLAA